MIPLVPMLSGDHVPAAAAAQLAGWPPLAFVGALVLDRAPGSRIGKACVALALTPWLLVGWALLRRLGPMGGAGFDHSLAELGPVPLALGGAVLLWSVGPAVDRSARRRRFWLLTIGVGVVATATPTWAVGALKPAGVVTMVGLWLIAFTVATLMFSANLRPVDEPVLDLTLALGVVAAAAGVGLLVRLGGQLVGLPSADISGVFSAMITAALATPGALWVRRSVLARRYGSGILPPGDVAAITADLHRDTDPRELLGKAATMVAAASGNRQVRIVLGEEAPDQTARWIVHPLVVGDSRVGYLLVDPPHIEGPEPRQQRVVAQLLPTVALVTRAVALAVEAEHARQDVARQRDAQRSRILSDLHDDLGPVLAGLSMRVRAELRLRPDLFLNQLSADLATCRADLRAIVSGLAPSALHGGDLAAALQQLVESFGESGGSPRVVLVDVPADEPDAEIAVAAYRCVAEGVTNAVRHARATEVRVSVGTASGRMRVQVTDDGIGGPVALGIGLTSLRRRAEQLGGLLEIDTSPGQGTSLRVDLPMVGAR